MSDEPNPIVDEANTELQPVSPWVIISAVMWIITAILVIIYFWKQSLTLVILSSVTALIGLVADRVIRCKHKGLIEKE